MHLTPGTEEEIASILHSANDGITLVGGGTRWCPSGQTTRQMTTANVNGIVDYEPAALTLVARCGTSLDSIERTLEESGQCLPFEPPRHGHLSGRNGVPTLGGAIATNASGPRRVQWGSCRDYVLGCRFVTGTGQILRSGGRVMKNVTGYDIPGLLCGSHGTLGIMTEIALKVLPMSRSSVTVTIPGLELADACEAMAVAMGMPLEVTGAAYMPRKGDERSRLIFRLEGIEDTVRNRSAELCRLLGSFGRTELDDDPSSSRTTWREIRDVRRFGSGGSIWRVCVKADQCPRLVTELGESIASDYMVDWAGGLIWIKTGHVGDIRHHMRSSGGIATLIRGEGNMEDVPRFHPQSRGVATILDGLRKQFDPRGILNPGIDLTGRMS